jgi:hypothetical protein
MTDMSPPHLDNDTVVYVGSVGPAARNRLLGKAFGAVTSHTVR